MRPFLGTFTARCHVCGCLGSLLCDPCAEGLKRAPTGPVPANVASCTGAFAYEDVARRLVLDLKLRRLQCAATPLARAMVRRLWAAGCRSEVISWVPADRRDIRRRGFDHARVLSARVADLTGLPMRPLLRRVARGPDQTALGRSERAANVARAFVACHDPPERVLLIDDLVTTGATAGACAAALRWCGCSSVEVLVACRA